MSILSFIKNWKDFSTIWAIIQPFILKLIKKKVPTTITKLYENLAKYTQPAIDSLFKLKGKIQNSPNELDDYCFNQGVNAIESFVAIGTVGVLNDKNAITLFMKGFEEMLKQLEPKEILIYGNKLSELDGYKNLRWFEPYMNKFKKVR
mgnify:FL=1